MSANENDVVLAFRQAVEAEMRRAQSENVVRAEIFAEGESAESALRKLVTRHEELEHEVALLRTIILKLISEPVDEQQT